MEICCVNYFAKYLYVNKELYFIIYRNRKGGRKKQRSSKEFINTEYQIAVLSLFFYHNMVLR